MQKLVTVINKLQDAFSSVKIDCPFDLPQIVVVGEQSSGKSSVLENFVGRDFLPRGSGIVTRRPLILQLLYNPQKEYVEFLHKSNRHYTNFDEVIKEIETETDRVTGKSKNVSNIPINMKFHSPHVLNLTLVDLPGITKVPVADQPPDIEIQIRSMILHFISNPNSIILAVIPAIIDLANSEALKLAREVDPNRMRTVGVITKIDMMDNGTDCLSTLKNSVYVLARGYVGVVNRSQNDIKTKKDIRAAQEDEIKFFQNHSKYYELKDKVGCLYLQKTLNSQLTEKIKETLPKLKESIMEKFYKYQEALEKMPGVASNPNQAVMIMIHELVQQVDIELGYNCECVDIENVSVGSEISQILFQRFLYEIEKIKPLPQKVKSEIKIAILNSQGIRRSIFSPGASFLAVIKSHIKFIEQPCNIVLDIVNQYIKKMMRSVVRKTFNAYPALSEEVQFFLRDKLQNYYQEAKEFLKIMIEIQLEHINTNHPDFLNIQDTDSSPVDGHSKTMIGGAESYIYRQDHLLVLNSSLFKSNRQHFGQLRGQILYIYKDSTKSELMAQIILSGTKIKDLHHKNSHQLLISSKDGRQLLKDKNTFEISHPNFEDLEAWKAAFVSSGVELDRSEEMKIHTQENSANDIDPELQKNIEYVYILFVSYIEIIIKLLQDLLSKISVYCIISKLRKSLFTDLVVHVYNINDLKNLLKESDEVVAERKHTMRMFKACKDALEAINEVMTETNDHFIMDRKYSPKEDTDFIATKSDMTRVESYSNILKEPDSFSDIRSSSDFDLNRKKNSLTTNEMKFSDVKKPKRPPPSSSKFVKQLE